jgi:hypothetical protein
MRRAIWLVCAIYVGSVIGIDLFARPHWQWHVLNPLAAVATIANAVILPGPLVVLGATAVASWFYVKGRIPDWSILGLVAGFATVAYLVVRHWSVG